MTATLDFKRLGYADFKKMPWKNGQGVTYEIARDKGDSLDDFGWRISMADVASDGAFSLFAGKQRLLSVISGAGIDLRIDNQPPQTVKTYQVIAFDGASQVDSALVNGAIRDLNVMYDPQQLTATLQWLASDNQITSHAHQLFLLSAADDTLLTVNGEAHVLCRYDCLAITTDNMSLTLTLTRGNGAVIQIFDRFNIV